MHLFASRRASDSLAARAAGDGSADFLSSMLSQRLRHDGKDPEIPRDLGHESVGVARDPDPILAEILGKRLRQVHILPASTHADADQMSPIPAPVPSPAAVPAIPTTLAIRDSAAGRRLQTSNG